MNEIKKPIVIGVGGFARAGKDTFVKVARKILTENGYRSKKLAFADALKTELDPFLKECYNISAFTENTDEKNLIRPLMVAHGCGKRIQTEGRYWVDKIDRLLRNSYEDVVFISDCRFPNEVDWVHENWGGWFVHLKKYSIDKRYYEYTDPDTTFHSGIAESKIFDKAPNDEEAKNDPICEKNADYKLELENVVEREWRVNKIRINQNDITDVTYLYNEIKLCLSKCPFLTIK